MRNTLVVLLILALPVVFFIGRSSLKITEKTVVEWKSMPTISVSITPHPVGVSIPDVPQLLYLTDTVTQMQIVDTAAILADWILKREYAGRVINDSTGTVDYSATIQYNQLQHFVFDYTPIQRIETTTKTIERKFIPFILVGGNSAGFGQVEAGALIGNFGLSVEVGSNVQGITYLGGKFGFRF